MQAKLFWLKQNTLFHSGKKEKNKFGFLQHLVLG